MSLKRKERQLAAIVWFNLGMGIYNIYIFHVEYIIFNLAIGILNIGVWAFLRNEELRVAYIRNKKNS